MGGERVRWVVGGGDSGRWRGWGWWGGRGEVAGVTGVVSLTRGRYPPSYLECLIHQDSENMAHC